MPLILTLTKAISDTPFLETFLSKLFIVYGLKTFKEADPITPSTIAHIHYYVFYALCYVIATASNLQDSTHLPHLIQMLSLIEWTSFFSPFMAFTGQARMQAPQPMHLLGII